MRRFHLIELHEQPWFPSFLRDEITGALQFGLSRANAYAPIAAMLERAVDSSRSQAIVDLCSGAGGPWLNLAQKLRSQQPTDVPAIPIRLTDKYPNLAAFAALSAASKNHIGSYAQPVDAKCVPRELAGFRTMFTSFHHFAPDEARAILQDAVDARQSIGIFEITRRAPSAIGFMLLWSIFLFICTPWIPPVPLVAHFLYLRHPDNSRGAAVRRRSLVPAHLSPAGTPRHHRKIERLRLHLGFRRILRHAPTHADHLPDRFSHHARRVSRRRGVMQS